MRAGHVSLVAMDGPIRELLRLPDFLRLWLVGGFANAMRWLELLISGVFAYEVTGSALAATAVVAARQLPQLAFGAFAGAISEAVDRKVSVMLALIVPALVSTLLATLATTGDRARFGDQRRHAHDRPAPGRARLPVAGHERRLHTDRAGAVLRCVRARRAGACAGDPTAGAQSHSRRHRRRTGVRPHQADHPAGLRHHHRHQRLCLRLFGPDGAVGARRIPGLAGPGRSLGGGRADRVPAGRRAD